MEDKILQMGQTCISAYDITKRTHYWAVLVTFSVDPSTEIPVLEPENAVSISYVGCYYCTLIHSPETALTACEYQPII